MKLFFIKSTLITLFVALGFYLAFKYARAKELPKGYQTMAGAIIDKHKRLSKLPSPKLITVGGSNVMFGFNSTYMEQELKMPVQNMALAAKDQKGESLLRSLFPFTWRKQEAEIRLRSEEILKKFKLIDKKDDFAAALSGGQRKLLELARALMVEPELIMLDEPMAGVNPALKQSLLEHIKDLRTQGKTVLFVEHDMDMVMEISDWVVVMAQGKIIAEGPPKSIINNQDVITAYLGAHHDTELDENSESMASKNSKGGVSQ